jgi:hypothetical protein
MDMDPNDVQNWVMVSACSCTVMVLSLKYTEMESESTVRNIDHKQEW